MRGTKLILRPPRLTGNTERSWILTGSIQSSQMNAVAWEDSTSLGPPEATHGFVSMTYLRPLAMRCGKKWMRGSWHFLMTTWPGFVSISARRRKKLRRAASPDSGIQGSAIARKGCAGYRDDVGTAGSSWTKSLTNKRWPTHVRAWPGAN